MCTVNGTCFQLGNKKKIKATLTDRNQYTCTQTSHRRERRKKKNSRHYNSLSRFFVHVIEPIYDANTIRAEIRVDTVSSAAE